MINDCKPACIYKRLIGTSLEIYRLQGPRVCSYQSPKGNWSNTAELPLNALWNFVNCPSNHRFCLRSAFCLSELLFNTLWNFTQTFVRFFVERYQKQRTNFTHFACITFAQYTVIRNECAWLALHRQLATLFRDNMKMKSKDFRLEMASESFYLHAIPLATASFCTVFCFAKLRNSPHHVPSSSPAEEKFLLRPVEQTNAASLSHLWSLQTDGTNFHRRWSSKVSRLRETWSFRIPCVFPSTKRYGWLDESGEKEWIPQCLPGTQCGSHPWWPDPCLAAAQQMLE